MERKSESKSEIRSRIDELERLKHFIDESNRSIIEARISSLKSSLEEATEDLYTVILDSHKAVCEAKNMGEKDAYGHDPTIYYSLGMAGEAGEVLNNITKAMRDGYDSERIKNSIKDELPDVVIYAFILAYVLDFNLLELVAEKAAIVKSRAVSGYYGKKFNKVK